MKTIKICAEQDDFYSLYENILGYINEYSKSFSQQLKELSKLTQNDPSSKYIYNVRKKIRKIIHLSWILFIYLKITSILINLCQLH